jgi:hypothetical protein
LRTHWWLTNGFVHCVAQPLVELAEALVTLGIPQPGKVRIQRQDRRRNALAAGDLGGH